MAGALEPVIATLLANTEDFNAKMAEAKAEMDALGDSAGAANAELATVGDGVALGAVSDDADEAAGALGGLTVAAGEASDGVKEAAEDSAGALSGITVAAGEGKDALSEVADTTTSEVAPAFDDLDQKLANSALFDLPALSPSLKRIGTGAGEAAGDVDKAATDMEESGGRVSATFHRIGNVAEAVGSDVGGYFGTVSHKVGNSLESAAKVGENSLSTLEKTGKYAAFGIGTAFIAVGAISLDLADKFEPVQAALQTAIDATGRSFAAWGPNIATLQTHFATLGFNMTQTDGALRILTTSTGNVKTAFSEMSLTANVARLQNISLASAATMVAKANAGSARIMTMWGINANIAGGKAHAVQTAMEALTTAQQNLKGVQEEVTAKVYKGTQAIVMLAAAHRAVSLAVLKHEQAEKAIGQILQTVSGRVKDAAKNYGDTLAGKMHIAGAEVENLGTKFGLMLIPVLLKDINVATKLFDWLTAHKPVLIAIGVIVGTVLVAAFTAWAISLVATAAPVMAVVVGLGLLLAPLIAVAAGIYELVKHWRGAWGFIRDIAEDVWHFLDNNVFHPIADFFTGVFASVLSAAKSLWDTVWYAIRDAAVTVWHAVYDVVLSPLITFFRAVFHQQLAAAKLDWNDLWQGIRAIATTVWHYLYDDILRPIISFFSGVFHDNLLAAEAIWNVVWGAIKATAQSVYNFLMDDIFHPIISFFEGVWSATIHEALSVWSTVWSAIKSVASAAWNFVYGDVLRPIASFFWGVWSSTVRGAESVWDSVWDGIKSAVETAWDFIKPIFDLITRGIDDITSGIGKLTGALSGAAHIASSVGGWIGKHVATGGLITSPSIVSIAEAGPELVLNAQQTQMALSGEPISTKKIYPVGGSGGGGNTATMTNYITISGAGLNEQQLANLVRTQLLQLSRGTRNAFGVFAGS